MDHVTLIFYWSHGNLEIVLCVFSNLEYCKIDKGHFQSFFLVRQ